MESSAIKYTMSNIITYSSPLILLAIITLFLKDAKNGYTNKNAVLWWPCYWRLLFSFSFNFWHYLLLFMSNLYMLVCVLDTYKTDIWAVNNCYIWVLVIPVFWYGTAGDSSRDRFS